MKAKMVLRMEELLREVKTVEDLTEIEKAVDEVKGKIALEPPQGFWADKAPCWEMCHCPEVIKKECPAFTYQSVPCWKIEGTYCKLNDYGAEGDDTTICRACRVYKKHGNGEPIEILLRGRGMLELKPMERLSLMGD